ncbi:MAG: rRNA cytosine-C5-methyltransferase [Muribaculaceae bacterium]|nr:rRNA cytosine-C5-methyltransferase [Muribaculaceae bacterium]
MELQDNFLRQLQALLPDEWQQLHEVISAAEPSVSVRVNAGKGVKLPLGADRVPWCDTGFYCSERPLFTFDPDFHAGRYYVQDASSMFIHRVLRQLVDTPVRYLDLCAAPGGKTTAAIDALPSRSLVVANEIVPSRARVLCDNVAKWGCPHTLVMNNTPADVGRLTHFFDVIAADVPCSGEGMMRKDEEAVAQWTPALVQECATRQRTIIADVWSALKPGGLFIYSTCTYNREENEKMVEFIIGEYGAESVPVEIAPEWNILSAIDTTFHAYRFMPHRTRGEGLFMAVLRKPLDQSLRNVKSKRARQERSVTLPREVAAWLKPAEDYRLALTNDALVALPLRWEKEMAMLRDEMNVWQSGVALATVKGKNYVPTQALALSTALNCEQFPYCEVDEATALAYLRGEAIVMDAPRGYVLVTHRQAPLGWANNLGNRANNLYPKSLRILSTHAPSTLPHVLKP